MQTPPIVTPQEWETAREQMLVREKEVTRARDALAAQRRRMPWLPVEKEYAFEGPKGQVSLLDLFEGRRQLIIYRAFFEDRKSTRLNSSHVKISYAVFCLKKKKKLKLSFFFKKKKKKKKKKTKKKTIK